MKESLQVAILGCGRMGKQRAALCERLGAQVRLLCDPDLDRAKELGSSFPNARVTDAGDGIDWSGIDAVFSCTPPFARGPIESAAVAAGAALFMEKPIALSLAAGIAMRDAARQAGVLSAVGYMNRYRDSVRKARVMVAERGLVGLSCHWVAAIYRVPWWGKRELSGGQINEQCTHFVDLIRYFCGEIVEVTAMSQPGAAGADVDIDVATSAMLRAANGTLATLYASCAATTKQIAVHVFTTSEDIRLENWNLALPGTTDNDPFETETAAFLQAVRTGDPSGIESTLDDALRTQATVDALVRSLDSHRWERVDPPAP